MGGGVVADVFKQDYGGQIVDESAVGLLLRDRLVCIHVDPSVGGCRGRGIGVVHDVPVDRLETVEGGRRGDGHALVGESEALQKCHTAAVTAAVDTEQGLPQECLVHCIGVGRVPGGGVDRVELAHRPVGAGGVVAEVRHGGERGAVVVVDGQHASVHFYVFDPVVVLGRDTYGRVHLLDLVLGDGLHDVIGYGQVHRVLVRQGGDVDSGEVVGIGRDVILRTASGGQPLHLSVVETGGRDVRPEVLEVRREHYTEGERGDDLRTAIGQIDGRHRRGPSAHGIGDALESALYDGIVGVTYPSYEGTALVHIGILVPERVDHGVLGGVDRVAEPSVVSGLLVVGGGGGVDGVYRVGQYHQKNGHQKGGEREELECLPGTGLDTVAPEGCEVSFHVHGPDDPHGQCGASDGECGTCQYGIVRIEPSHKEHGEEEQHGEPVHPGVGVLPVSVKHPSAVDQREPEGEPSVIRGHAGDACAGCAVDEGLHEAPVVHAVPVGHRVGYLGQSEGEGDGDDRDGDDEYGDRDDPRLLLDGREGDAERDGQETEDESTGEHGVPQSDGDVITCSEDESDGEDRVDYEGGGPHVPSADTLDDHRYRETDRRDDDIHPEIGPGKYDRCEEYPCEDGVPEGGLVVEDALGTGDGIPVHRFECRCQEVDHPGCDEADEREARPVGERGRHDEQREEGVEQGCDDTDGLVSLEHLLGGHVDGDAGERSEYGGGPCEDSGGRGSVRDPEEGHDERDGGDNIVEKRTERVRRSEGVVQCRIPDGTVGTRKDLLHYAEVVGSA